MIYEANYGDDEPCQCGHPYDRHFDSYDHMRPVGCKYCACYEFQAMTARTQNVFFTSDQHYGHKRICEFAKRPFANADDMAEEFIKRHNEVVKPGDRVYHLGDFSFQKPRDATNIARRFNHDEELRDDEDFEAEWVWCKDLAEIKVGDQKIVLCHFPMMAWNKSHHGSFHVHGHCHGTLKPDQGALRVDAGVDVWDYRPVSFEEIAREMSKKTFVPVDQHGARGNGV